MIKRLCFFRFCNGEEMKEVLTVSGIEITRFNPTLLQLQAHRRFHPIYLFWFLFTRGRYRIYYVKDEAGKVIHYSHVLPKFFKFPFMQRGDLQIGPSWTDPARRGQRIYPAVIAHILRREQRQGRCFYMMAAEANRASCRGIERTGFTPCGIGEKQGWLGIYRIQGGVK